LVSEHFPWPKKGIIFWLFLQIFSREKRGRHTSGSDMKIYEQNLAKKIGYLNSSRKNTQFQKKKSAETESGSKVMSILNSTSFSGFFQKKTHDLHSKLFLNPSFC
jgi:hypothetical protein